MTNAKKGTRQHFKVHHYLFLGCCTLGPFGKSPWDTVLFLLILLQFIELLIFLIVNKGSQEVDLRL